MRVKVLNTDHQKWDRPHWKAFILSYIRMSDVTLFSLDKCPFYAKPLGLEHAFVSLGANMSGCKSAMGCRVTAAMKECIKVVSVPYKSFFSSISWFYYSLQCYGAPLLSFIPMKLQSTSPYTGLTSHRYQLECIANMFVRLRRF